jgi:hypothetical protein
MFERGGSTENDEAQKRKSDLKRSLAEILTASSSRPEETRSESFAGFEIDALGIPLKN